jgi:hypothetical protein|tara:strand:- start:6192 stop:6524 length:333 start_codon:yes stop_codon:yes gene_type:complete
MQHEAIRALHDTVTLIKGYGSEAVAMDKDGNIVSWDASAVAKKQTELEEADNLNRLREARNTLLSETDWWDASDTADMTDEQKKYRQDLRDITKTYSSLDDVKWPTKPSG